jgi:hypothetical protein
MYATTQYRTEWKQRLSALALAALFTAGMLGGVDLLATQDIAASGPMAQAAASAPRS